MRVIFKSTVRIKEYSEPIEVMLSDIRRLYAPCDCIVITSINDSTHGLNSRHYKNEALDIRTVKKPGRIGGFDTRKDKRQYRSDLEASLNIGYGEQRFRVLLEDEGTDNEHLHVQVKKGYKWPYTVA